MSSTLIVLVNPDFSRDNSVLFSGNLGRFVPGHSGHNLMQRPFFTYDGPEGQKLPLFNAMTAYLYFEIFGKVTSMAATALPGRIDRYYLSPGPDFGRVTASCVSQALGSV